MSKFYVVPIYVQLSDCTDNVIEHVKNVSATDHLKGILIANGIRYKGHQTGPLLGGGYIPIYVTLEAASVAELTSMVKNLDQLLKLSIGTLMAYQGIPYLSHGVGSPVEVKVTS